MCNVGYTLHRLVEHLLSIVHVCTQIPYDDPDKFVAYFSRNYPHLFDFFEFSTPLAIFAVVMSICNVFSWNFLDAFLIIMSIALTQKFEQVTSRVLVAYNTKLATCSHKATTVESVYFSFSFGLLVLRTVAVTLFASNINDESTKSMSYLLSLNSDTYSSEIDRFVTQIHCQSVALTGNDFFTITRGLLFSMAGSIVTYELFLIQSNEAVGY
ncbi:gustatory receptor for sugar taste 64f-like [Tenebrio molitor]|uniref:gustatory receptor for sugar taste 64f-like n=1 Tax=Tenebrio molitor TaxID=7067 RepID=UPI0036247B33